MAALNTPLVRARLPEEEEADDEAELALMAAAAGEELEEVRRRRQRTRRLQKLFAGCRVFIGREVREGGWSWLLGKEGGSSGCGWSCYSHRGAFTRSIDIDCQRSFTSFNYYCEIGIW